MNTYRESVRARILLGLAGVAFAIALYSVVVGAFTLQDAPRVISDLGAASISVFSVAVTVVISSTSLHRELEQKTLFPILARPIRRSEYIVGKYLGTVLTILVFIMADAGLVLTISSVVGGDLRWGLVLRALLAFAAFGVAAWRSPWVRTYGPIPLSLALLVAGTQLSSTVAVERRVVLGSAVLTLLEVLILAGIATLFASFSTPFLSALLTLGVFLIGRSADSLVLFPNKLFPQPFGQWAHNVAAAVGKVVPNLYVYVPPRPLLAGESAAVPLSSYIAMAAIAAVAWAVGLLAVASLSFKRRDFL